VRHCSASSLTLGFDNYVGVVMLVRVVNGTLKPKDKITLMANGSTHLVEHVGVFSPKSVDRPELSAGQVGFIIAGIKELKAAKVGDTVTHAVGQVGRTPAVVPLPGFKEVKSQVFAGLYPVEASEYDQLRESLEKLKLNDASLLYEPEVSQSFRFWIPLWVLRLVAHGDRTRTFRTPVRYEFDYNRTNRGVSSTASDGTILMVDNPSKMPETSKVDTIMEPIVTVNLYMPQEYVGSIITLCVGKRGIQTGMNYLGRQVQLTYELPMAEIVMDFFDRLKSISRGYASMDYEFKEYRPADVVKVDILINGDRVDALSVIVHRSNSQHRGREVVSKMRGIIPRQMFDVAIQAAIGSNIVARENVKALRKNVLAKCYGGDISRKRKLLEKQKEGKKRMKQVGNVEIPQEALLSNFAGRRLMNFALILFILVIVSGIAWIADKLYFAPQRVQAGIARMPLWLEYTAGFFPVICAVFVLRSFIVEPFKIPSGSMIPTLQIGDFIWLINLPMASVCQ
jgi:GTP-binding protein LepA